MQLDWTAEVVGRMHMAGITGIELANEAGIRTHTCQVCCTKSGAEMNKPGSASSAHWTASNRKSGLIGKGGQHDGS